MRSALRPTSPSKPNLTNSHRTPLTLSVGSLNTQKVSLILTAHPTEVNRKTLLTQTRRVQSYLAAADDLRTSGSEYERREVSKGLEAAVQGIWMSDEVSR